MTEPSKDEDTGYDIDVGEFDDAPASADERASDDELEFATVSQDADLADDVVAEESEAEDFDSFASAIAPKTSGEVDGDALDMDFDLDAVLEDNAEDPADALRDLAAELAAITDISDDDDEAAADDAPAFASSADEDEPYPFEDEHGDLAPADGVGPAEPVEEDAVVGVGRYDMDVDTGGAAADGEPAAASQAPVEDDDGAMELMEEVAPETIEPAHEDDVYGAPIGISDRPVPRITIAAYCELPETAALVRRAAGDRRCSRAHVQVEMGGLSAAIERHHDEATPNLIIVESGMRGKGLFAQLGELAQVCDPDTRVIVIGAANDIGLYRELISRGVSEYLVPPLTPVHLIRAIAAQFTDPEQPFHGKTVAFIGAKGGVGSSTIAHNVGWCAAELFELDATIVDLDLSFGTVGLDFNHDAMQGVGDALAEPDRIDDVLLDRLVSKITDRLTLFTAPANLEREWELDPEAYDTVVDAVRKTVPLVILDLPHVWTGWMRNVLLTADEVVVTAGPDLASLRNTKNIFDLVNAARPNDAPPKVVLNQVGVPKRPEIPVKDFAEALGAEPDLVLPFEPALFGAAANAGQMIVEMKPGATASEGMRHIATAVSGREQPSRRTSLIAKLLKRK